MMLEEEKKFSTRLQVRRSSLAKTGKVACVWSQKDYQQERPGGINAGTRSSMKERE